MEAELNGFIIWEISGDLMPDLTTPLIDAVHHKLSDPSLDCKTLSYDKSTFSGYSVLPAIPKPITMSSSLSGAAGSENGASKMNCPSVFFWGKAQFNGAAISAASMAVQIQVLSSCVLKALCSMKFHPIARTHH